jgi:hypothetical protein
VLGSGSAELPRTTLLALFPDLAVRLVLPAVVRLARIAALSFVRRSTPREHADVARIDKNPVARIGGGVLLLANTIFMDKSARP